MNNADLIGILSDGPFETNENTALNRVCYCSLLFLYSFIERVEFSTLVCVYLYENEK